MQAQEEGHGAEREGKRIRTVLGEFRMMVPALGALLGFQLVVAFQPTFADLSQAARIANFLGVACSVLAILFLLMPVSYHRFPHDLDESHGFLRFAQSMISLAFVFFPVSLAASIFVQAERTFHDDTVALAIAVGVLAALVVAWWLVPWRRARARREA